MDYEGIEARPGLRLEDARHGAGVEGVGSEPVDGLGREGYESSGGDAFSRAAERAVLYDPGFPFRIPLLKGSRLGPGIGIRSERLEPFRLGQHLGLHSGGVFGEALARGGREVARMRAARRPALRRPVHGDRSDGDARRHLDYGQEAVEAIEGLCPYRALR